MQREQAWTHREYVNWPSAAEVIKAISDIVTDLFLKFLHAKLYYCSCICLSPPYCGSLGGGWVGETSAEKIASEKRFILNSFHYSPDLPPPPLQYYSCIVILKILCKMRLQIFLRTCQPVANRRNPSPNLVPQSLLICHI
uniref:Uncharacterized protein n=1 Tax=Sphaerodactylus townsendi TaxID=933632 RepID=A0ACB8EIU9_9SAUR